MQSVPDQYTNLTWLDDDGLWRAWTFNEVQNRYYFDDLGDESFMKVWEYLGEKDGEEQESLWEGTLIEL